ncbi:acetoacetate decarboxylase family protein [Actinokineospora sp. G85]|uniref:acetoacetate decarboxylase family protein n=1 Tax=Actinokineospora sp. G85 TaxID=3406626 RepID=UPI003C73B367
MTYPPEPWALRGDLHLSVWFVRGRFDVPEGVSVVRVGPFAVVGTAWVDYQEGSVLTYRELMAAVLVRKGLRLLPTITGIWVDSPESRDGGRALWGIPKDLAEFSVAGPEWTAEGIARARVVPGARLPGRLPVGFSVAQTLAGALKVSRVRSTTGLRLGRVDWDVRADGPLGFLAGRSPAFSASMTGFDMRFGG